LDFTAGWLLARYPGLVDISPLGCWKWVGPFRNGYVRATTEDGRSTTLPKLTFETFTGAPAPGRLRHIATCVWQSRCISPLPCSPGSTPRRSRRRVSPQRHLTARQVRRMRQLYAAGGTTMSALARRFNVNPGTVKHIIARRTYRTVK